MTKDTARDPEKAEETKSENEKSAEDKEKSSKKKVASVTSIDQKILRTQMQKAK